MSAEIANQLPTLPLAISAEKCSGCTYIVTGANTGLGLEAAKHLVAVGAAKVILGVRNVPAGEAAKDRIIKETGITGSAEVWALDLSSYDSVKAFAKKAIAELDRIDAVIENAAVASGQGKAEGHNLSMTVNVYSTILLALLLLPKLKEIAKRFGITPHIAIVTSGAALDLRDNWSEIRDDPLVKADDASIGLVSYPLSKLFEIFVVRELAKLLPVSETGVVLNLVNPGLCKTELSRNAPLEFQQQLAEMHAKFGRTAEVGSRTLLHGAVGGNDSHGSYLSDCEVADYKLPSWITDEEGNKDQKLIWNSLAKELEIVSPGSVKSIL